MPDFFEREQDLINSYNALKPLLQEWGRFVDEYIIQLLATNGFEIARIQISPKFRIKENNSLISKAFYRSLEISSDPLRRIEDKVGTRIVVTTIDDVKSIRDIVISDTSFWLSRESRSLDRYLAKPREFDYHSLHINLTPTINVKGFEGTSKRERENYICELQVRTLLQHAFAEVAHDTIYKGPYGADSQLVRIMSRGVALMETTDEYFCRAYEIMQQEEIYEKSFLNKLIAFSNERLDLAEKFHLKQVDNALTNELFHIFEVKGINISDLERNLITNKPTVESAIKNTNSYLKSQPVILLILHLIYSNTYLIKEKWHLEDGILNDLFYKVGFSTRR